MLGMIQNKDGLLLYEVFNIGSVFASDNVSALQTEQRRNYEVLRTKFSEKVE